MAVSDYMPAVDREEARRAAATGVAVGGAVVLAVVLTVLSVWYAMGVY